MSGGAAEPAIGEQMSKITIGCIKPPKPPKPPKSKHKGRDRDHEHDDD
jgi:hypothetical protein